VDIGSSASCDRLGYVNTSKQVGDKDHLKIFANALAQRRTDAGSPYLLVNDTLDECIRQFPAKPPRVRHLYETHTSPQAPLVDAVVSEEIVAELARL
jgi:hypothetical protein